MPVCNEKQTQKNVSPVDQITMMSGRSCHNHTIHLNCTCSLDGLMCARLFVKGAAEMVLDLCTQQVPYLRGAVYVCQHQVRVAIPAQSWFVTFRWDRTAG